MPIRYPEFGERLSRVMAEKKIDVVAIVEFFRLHAMPTTYEMVRRYTLGQAMPRQNRMEILALCVGESPAGLQFGQLAGSVTVVQAPKAVPISLFKGLNAQIAKLRGEGIPDAAIELLESAIKGAEAITAAQRAKVTANRPTSAELTGGDSNLGDAPDDARSVVEKARDDLRSAAKSEGGRHDKSGNRDA